MATNRGNSTTEEAKLKELYDMIPRHKFHNK